MSGRPDTLGLISEEVEALTAIYGEENVLLRDQSALQIKFYLGTADSTHVQSTIEYWDFSLYPYQLPRIEIRCDSLLPSEEVALAEKASECFSMTYSGRSPQPMLFDISEYIMTETTNLLESKLKKLEQDSFKSPGGLGTSKAAEIPDHEELPSHITIFHSEPRIDRKSIFQGHAAVVHTVKEAQQFIQLMKQCNKIGKATHNITAYRITSHTSDLRSIIQEHDSDGESNAGYGLQNLLELNDAMNVVVMVSRWYGGIQLGPDRFKHIRATARESLLLCGAIKPTKR